MKSQNLFKSVVLNVFNILKSYGGEITSELEENKGVIFVINLRQST